MSIRPLISHSAPTVRRGLLLSDPLPLRSTVVWGNYDSPQPIPLIYGTAVVEPVQFSRDRKKWCIADHACVAIEWVKRDDQKSPYAFNNTLDSTGHAVAVIELSEPLRDGERLSVRAHGTPLVNPADVIADVLSWAGWGGTSPALAQFRAQCARAGLNVGGVLHERVTLRAAIAQICDSVGAVWSGGVDGLALLWPPVSASASVHTLGSQDVIQPSASADFSDLATVLTLLYDYDWAAGKHLRSITVESVPAVQRYGLIERHVDAGWLHSNVAASALAERLLTHMAAPRWTVKCGFKWHLRTIKTGQVVTVDHLLIPTGRALVAALETDYSNATCAATLWHLQDYAPAVRLRQLAESWEPLEQSGVQVQYENGVLTLTILDDAGSVLAGASVTLDGTTTRRTDTQGRVQFSTSRGAHTIYVEAMGYAPMSAEFSV